MKRGARRPSRIVAEIAGDIDKAADGMVAAEESGNDALLGMLCLNMIEHCTLLLKALHRRA